MVRVRNDDLAESRTLDRVRSGGVILVVSDKVVWCIRQIEGVRAELPFDAR